MGKPSEPKFSAHEVKSLADQVGVKVRVFNRSCDFSFQLRRYRFIRIQQHDPGSFNVLRIENPLSFLWIASQVIKLDHFRARLLSEFHGAVVTARVNDDGALSKRCRTQAASDIHRFVENGHDQSNG